MELNSLMLASALTMYVLPIVWLIIGLGLVIFVHELGHFLMAKAVDIKVEKFSLGFGPKLLGFQRGETEYCLSALPLGGYVKMLGQEDFKPIDGGQADPRAFNNKPVWARLVVVSAGVVMNVIFAGLLFIIVGMVGIDQPAAVLGVVKPGFPAAKAAILWDQPIPVAAAIGPVTAASSPATDSAPATASGPASSSAPAMVKESIGMRPGDTILSVNNKEIHRFQTVAVRSILAAPTDEFTFRIERRLEDGKVVQGTAKLGVKPDTAEDNRLTFGMGNAADLTLVADPSRRTDSPFKNGDTIVAIDGKPLANFFQLESYSDRLNKSPVTVTVQRDSSKVDIAVPLRLYGGRLFLLDDKNEPQPLNAAILQETPSDFKVQYPDGKIETIDAARIAYSKTPTDELLSILGMAPRMRITGVAEGTPADKAHLQPGDVIVNYGDLGTAPGYKQLQELNAKFAGKGTDITVMRNGKIMPAIWIVPKDKNGRAELGILWTYDYDTLAISNIEPDSPAAKAGLKSGDVIEDINGQPLQTWQELFFKLNELQGKDVTLRVRRNTQAIEYPIGKLTPFIFDPLAYHKSILPTELSPGILNVRVQMSNPVDAFVWGCNETWDFTLDTYISLRRLVGGTVSVSEVRGPLGIGSAAIKMGQNGFVHMLYFMAIISISLAVINFLPIPVVDGGHVVFLAIEKIQRKPVSTKAQNIAQIIGMVFLLCLFLLATKNDLFRMWAGKW